MRLAPSLGLALAPLALLAWACASPAEVLDPAPVGDSNPAKSADESSSSTRRVDLSRERRLVEEARAAVTAVDLAAAREKACEAIELLLERPDSERDAGWLRLVDTAGLLAWDAQDASAARAAWEQAVEVRSRMLPEDHPELQAARLNLSVTLWTLGDLAEARTLQEQVLEVQSRTLPEDHLDLQKARVNLAVTLLKLGDLAGARALQERVLEVFSRTLPEDHPDLQTARQNLAITFWTLGELAAARPLQEQVLEVRSRTLPEDHPDIQKARQNLSVTLLTLGELAAARALDEQVLEVRSRTLPEDHPDLQAARLNLAGTLVTLGDLAAARALQEKVLEVQSRILPEDHPDLQMARESLASSLWTLGDLAAARALQEKVLEVRSRMLPEDHPDLQAARASLAGTLLTLGELAAARTLQEEVLEVASRTLPKDHPDLQTARVNLAVTLWTQGDLTRARALEEQVLEVQSRTLPGDHPDLQTTRQNVALTLRTRGDLAAARALEEKILEVRSRTLPEDHPDLQATRCNLALTLAAGHAAGRAGDEERKGEEEGGRKAFARLAASFTRAIARSARAAVLGASSREAEERCANSLTDLGRALSFAEGVGVFESDPGLQREVFVLSEETRGAALASAHLSRRASADPGYGTLREAMRSASDELARLAQQGAGADEIDRARSAREATELELAQLARKLSAGEEAILELDPASLSASLSEHEALVGYRRYTRSAYEPGGGTEPKSAESLCAFVLRSGDRLERIDLGPIEPIEQAVSSFRQAIGAGGGRGLGAGAAQSVKEDLVQTEGRVARRLIFDPLLPALEGVERIVVALDDVLNLVPFDALPLETNTGPAGPAERPLLGDRWRIETRCTLSELLWTSTPVPSSESLAASGGTPVALSAALVAIGGAAFDLHPLLFTAEETESINEQRAASPDVASLLRGGAWEAGFVPLEETGPEAHGIAALFGEAFEGSRPALVLETRKASRASLAKLAPSARFLHIATHGWFAPESVRSIADPEPLDKLMGFGSRMSGEERARGMSPMLLCGLALAGANLKEDDLGRAPGLVTAEEISALDLSSCELAVLSACDTNVGERRAGQGVASLQKALHMAGARTVITSLWKVPDEATRELMLDFYRRIWIEKKPKGVALWEAKMKIRNAKDERGRLLYSTRDWAAWVLTGEPN